MSPKTGSEDTPSRVGFSTIQHLVKSEDLNHHRTLYAGRLAEWFIETGFIAASYLIAPENIVCLKVHGLEFLRPVHVGEIATFTGKIVYTGKSSIIAYVQVEVFGKRVVDGFLTFINVDENGKAIPHGLSLTPVTEEDRELYERAKALLSANKV
jgi:acyl-CoA hydrolase